MPAALRCSQRISLRSLAAWHAASVTRALRLRPQVVRGSVPVAQQLSVTVAAAAVFFFVSEGALHPDALLAVDGAPA